MVAVEVTVGVMVAVSTVVGAATVIMADVPMVVVAAPAKMLAICDCSSFFVK